MKRDIARQPVRTQLAAVVLSLLCFLPGQVYTQETTSYLLTFPSVGLTHGQTLRLTLFNPEGEPVRASVQVRHTNGILVALADGSVRGGDFHTFDFTRSNMPLPGEAGTGRLQLLITCTIRLAEPSRKVDELAISLETLSVPDGTSSTFLIGEVLPRSQGSGQRRNLLLPRFDRDVLIGVVPDQKLRITLFSPPEAQPRPISNGRIKIFDKSASLIAQSDEFTIVPGAVHSFDFDGSAFAALGEPETGRVQLRIKPDFEFDPERPPQVLASFELINPRTGKTEVLAGQECLVFFLGGRPR